MRSAGAGRRAVIGAVWLAAASGAYRPASAVAHGLAVLGTSRPEAAAAELGAIFGPHTAFSASARVTEKDQINAVVRVKEMSYAFLDGKLRIETDAAKDSELSPDAVRDKQARGTDRTVRISEAGKQTALILYPALNAYREVSQPRRAAPPPIIDKVKVGEETVDGHPCVKQQIAITDDARRVDVFTWEATDLQAFPVRVVIVHGDTTYTIKFLSLKLARPAETLFEPPPHARKYDTLDQLIEGGGDRRRD